MAEKKTPATVEEKIAKLKEEISAHENVLRMKRAKLRELEQKKALADAEKNAALVKSQAAEIEQLKKQLAAQQAATPKTNAAASATATAVKTAATAKTANAAAKPAVEVVEVEEKPSLEALMNAAKKS